MEFIVKPGVVNVIVKVVSGAVKGPVEAEES